MKCVICKHGETRSGNVTVTLQRGDSIVVIKDVPADVCQQCGEYYLDEQTATKVTSMAEAAVHHHAERNSAIRGLISKHIESGGKGIPENRMER